MEENKLAESIVYNEDCMTVMARYPDNHFDLAVVDPPYGINDPKNPGDDKPKGNRLSGCGKKSVLSNRILVTMGVEWDYEKPSPEYFAELFRVSKNQVIWGGNYFPLPPTRCVIAWDKMQPWANFSQVEIAWTSFDYPAKLYRLSNMGDTPEKKKIHPTQKPIALYDKIYLDFSKGVKTVLDTHLGSGSNRISADKFGLDFVGCEIDEKYFEASDVRFRKFKAQQRLF